MTGIEVRATYSVCPVCRQRIPASLVRRGEAITMEKTCPEHGFFSVSVWRGYFDIDDWRGGVPSLSPEDGDDCPHACGLCKNHQSGTCCVLLEVTKRCDLLCPYCFANGGEGEDRPYDEVVCDIRSLAVNGQTLLQLSGGEPTVRDDLPELIREAKLAGCRYVQLNTNGVRIANEPAYLQKLKVAGLSFVFLQFDALDDGVYRALRGRDLFAVKKKAIENCGALQIGVTLVPTVVPGVNDHQVGDILRFAASLSPMVRGVHFQPVSYFGRTPAKPADEQRYTLDQLLNDVRLQAADMLCCDSLKPSRCDHPLCGFHGDYAVLPDGTLYSLLANGNGTDRATAEQNRAFVARRWDRGQYPESENACCCEDSPYVRSEQDCEAAQPDGRQCPCETVDMRDMEQFLRRVRTHGFTVTAMAFQDAWNLDLERLRRCSLHVYKEGRFIPFCRNYL